MSGPVSDHAYCARLVQGLATLYQSGLFCDVTLCVAERRFRVHRNILSAASPYFNALFTGGLSEAGQETVVIHDMASDVMGSLLLFIYTGLRFFQVFDFFLLSHADNLYISRTNTGN